MRKKRPRSLAGKWRTALPRHGLGYGGGVGAQQGEALPLAEEGSMLGRRSAQRGVWEGDARYVDLVGRDTFYGWLAGKRDDLFADERFADFYREGWCPTTVPPGLLATALALPTSQGVS